MSWDKNTDSLDGLPYYIYKKLDFHFPKGIASVGVFAKSVPVLNKDKKKVTKKGYQGVVVHVPTGVPTKTKLFSTLAEAKVETVKLYNNLLENSFNADSMLIRLDDYTIEHPNSSNFGYRYWLIHLTRDKSGKEAAKAIITTNSFSEVLEKVKELKKSGQKVNFVQNETFGYYKERF